MQNQLKVERNIPISFVLNGKSHVTFIDFKINNTWVEVKGGHLLNGCFDIDKEVTIQDKIKIYKDNNVLSITDSEQLLQNLGLKGLNINIFTKYIEYLSSDSWNLIEQLMLSSKFIQYSDLIIQH